MYTELEDITFDKCLSVVYNDLQKEIIVCIFHPFLSF